jgi:thymidylate synthase ThyX
MSQPYATIITDSISEQGHRLTTFEVRFHRFVLAEFNTHRVFSRNSSSSRAIPYRKQTERVTDDPAYPLRWISEKKGMQGGDELPEDKRWIVHRNWTHARDSAVMYAQRLDESGVHKSLVNRLIEPFMWHTVIVSSTAWSNFFQQRVSPLAQPEIQAVATLMLAEYESSEPKYLEEGDWHLPYIRDDDWDEAGVTDLIKVSVARCARVSYLTHDGVRSLDKDYELYERLITSSPMHASPLEHVATPDSWNIRKESIPHSTLEFTLPRVGNFVGWRQHRLEVERDKGVESYV